ncbi:flavohemoglobin expression-modulating QEGLA motif protein [Candidatus Woesearchaeota archaeon]|nr:flavohemoglobin expression-modulating QEGLA motif protein [Candidatus Woesearchaeota archaeon]
MSQKKIDVKEFDKKFCDFIYKYGLDEEYEYFKLNYFDDKKNFFFKNDFCLPENFFEYSRSDLTDCESELISLKEELSFFKNEDFYFIYSEKISELEFLINLIHNISLEDFKNYSLKIYGHTNFVFFLLAKFVCLNGLIFRKRKKMFLNENEMLSVFYSYLNSNNMSGWSVEISSDMVGDARISKVEMKIYIRKKDRYVVDDVISLLYHEVGVHVRRFQEGKKSLEIFSVGLAFYDELEEGLATYYEFRKSFLFDTLYSSALKYLAVYYAERFDFETVFRKTKKFCNDLDLVFHYVVRAKRGTNGVGAYTKDAIYFSGFVKFLFLRPFYRLRGLSWKSFMLFKFGFRYICIFRSLKRIYIKYANK